MGYILELLLDEDEITEEDFEELDVNASDWVVYGGVITAIFVANLESELESIESKYEYCAV